MYEKYQNFNHGYLTYTYKDDLGVFYLRTYHKNSLIRTTTDFRKDKGEMIETFTTNGIEWKSYELSNLIGTHFIGSKDEYIYEVVSQVSEPVTYQETKELLKSLKPIN